MNHQTLFSRFLQDKKACNTWRTIIYIYIYIYINKVEEKKITIYIYIYVYILGFALLL